MLPFERLILTKTPFRSAPLWRSSEIVRWMPPHVKDFQLLFVEAGAGILFVNDTTSALSKGICFILEPGSRAWGWHEPHAPLRAFSCTFALEGWNEEMLWNNGRLLAESSFLVISAHQAQLFHQRRDQDGHELARRLIEQVVLSLWDETRHFNTERKFVLDALAAEVKQQPERSWNLDYMAKQTGLSRSQFVRQFRSHFSCAPLEFVTRVRLKRAQELLMGTALPLDFVARAVGYNDGAFLSRQFKATFGEAPGAWRRRQKISEKFSLEPIDSEE